MPRIQVELDGTAVGGWLATISSEFPDDEFRILATRVRDDGAQVILEARTSSGGAVVDRFQTASEARALEVLHADEETILLRFTTEHSKAYDPLAKSKNVSVYPTILRDGWFSVTLVAEHERLSRYTDELVAAGIPYEVLSVSQSYEPTELLTERQLEIVTEAVERGYYNSPRNCTVTELATSLDIHKSAASRLLHRAECRIIPAFLDGVTE
ncbi:helix-turn-helix domain-containing protein [Natrinema sp. 74]|uniref:helix-turn-helix domain-containing protein n=1 Tax=Natrinema sp. 74 TaxID=3384159 RepID=UPI0038D47154